MNKVIEKIKTIKKSVNLRFKHYKTELFQHEIHCRNCVKIHNILMLTNENKRRS